MNHNKRTLDRQRKRLRVEVGGTPTFTIDVSPGGFCAEAMRVLPPGSDVRGKIRLQDHDVDFTGQVAWAKPGDPRLQVRGRMGVKLTGIAHEYYGMFSDGATPARPRR